MKKRKKWHVKQLVISVFRILILLAIGYIIIYPLFYMIVTSLKSREAFYASARVWIPNMLAPAYSFAMAIQATDFWSSLKSTLTHEIVAAFIEVASCAVAAYGFARFEFKWKKLYMAGLFLTILIPETMIMIPRMANYSKVDILGILGGLNSLTGVDLRLNLIGSPWAFYLPSLFAMGLRSGILMFIYIQFFKGLPQELEEAAWVDGAGPIRTFVSIALPSSGVVFITVILFAVIWHWNDTLLAAMYLKENYPLAVMLDRIVVTLESYGYYGAQRPEIMAILMAACVLFVAPVLILYMILQRWFIESIDNVGIKG